MQGHIKKKAADHVSKGQQAQIVGGDREFPRFGSAPGSAIAKGGASIDEAKLCQAPLWPAPAA